MALASIGGYRSPVNLGLGRVPLTTDPELFNEFTEVYNAIHLLNQYLDRLRVAAEGGGGGSEQDPDVTAGFTRFFVGNALQTIAVGDLVSPFVGSDGIVKGCLANGLTSSANALFSGVALTAAAIGEPVRVGAGPAVLALPGAVSGQRAYGINSRKSDGSYAEVGTIYTAPPGVVNGAVALPVGVGIAPGFIIIGNFVSK